MMRISLVCLCCIRVRNGGRFARLVAVSIVIVTCDALRIFVLTSSVSRWDASVAFSSILDTLTISTSTADITRTAGRHLSFHFVSLHDRSSAIFLTSNNNVYQVIFIILQLIYIKY